LYRKIGVVYYTKRLLFKGDISCMAERSKLRIAIYGAGNFCRNFFNKGFADEYEVIAIIDSDKNKIGTELFGILICSLDSVQDIDRIIIAVKDKDSISDKLVEAKFHPQQIWYFDGDTDELKPYVKDIEQRFLLKNAVEQICRSLLLESYYAGECAGFHRIVVLGDEWQYLIIKDFFDTINDGHTVIPETEIGDGMATDKYVITCADYREKIRELRSKGTISDWQWVIIPLFDVKASVL